MVASKRRANSTATADLPLAVGPAMRRARRKRADPARLPEVMPSILVAGWLSEATIGEVIKARISLAPGVRTVCPDDAAVGAGAAHARLEHADPTGLLYA